VSIIPALRRLRQEDPVPPGLHSLKNKNKNKLRKGAGTGLNGRTLASLDPGFKSQDCQKKKKSKKRRK
jgi:hypothetical protein